MGEKKAETVEKFKYVGTLFDSGLKFDKKESFAKLGLYLEDGFLGKSDNHESFLPHPQPGVLSDSLRVALHCPHKEDKQLFKLFHCFSH